MGKTLADLDSKMILGSLITDPAALRTEFAIRKDAHIYKSVHPADQARHEEDGWEVYRDGKARVRLKKEKTHDVLLEDQVWCLFYRMSYPTLSGKRFKIKYQRQDGSSGEKQIDVLAKDDETVVVAECKSKETRGRRSLQKDLHETEALQKALATSIRAAFGPDYKPKFIWLYVTKNIVWSEPDVDRAGATNVRIVTENEMQYFDSFIRHMGPAGRFQFLAEFLGGQTIPGLTGLKVPATRGKLGGHKFYSFVSTPRHLLKIAFVNHQALNHPDGRPAYQRMISPSRIEEIQKYITGGGFFPTNILINFSEECRFDLLSNRENADENIKFGWLYLPNKYKSAWIIDGQHRLYGYSHLTGEILDQPIAVIAFERMPVVDEANLFVTINQKQKPVQRSVIVSLQADLKLGSSDPKEKLGAVASTIAKQLSVDPTGPFAQRFAIHGVMATEAQSITIPEMVNGLLRSALLGKIVHGNHVPGALSAATDEETFRRAKRVLNLYFGAIRDANVQRWEGAREHFISTNPGVRGHLLLLSEIIRHLELKNGIDATLTDEDTLVKHVVKVAQPVLQFLAKASDTEVKELFSRKFGEGGVKEYFENLCELICRENSEFGTDELRKSLALKSDQRISQANDDVIRINRKMQDYIFTVLKRVHGVQELKSGQKSYWEAGVESQKAKTEAYKRQVEDTREKQPLEAYLTVLDLRDIVRQKNNWPHFQDVFNIPLPGEHGKHYYLDWMTKFNDLRRIPAHPSGGRTYTEEDYDFIRFLKENFLTPLAQKT